MTTDTSATGGLFRRWLRASFLGWLLGLVVLLALAVLGDAVGGTGESGAQYMIGVSIGGGVGFLQSRVLADWLERPARWLLASAVGMGALFVLHDVVALAGSELPFSLPVYVLMGALVVAVWQRNLLREVSVRADSWLVPSFIGWALPSACIALSDRAVFGPVGRMAGPVAILFGGIMVGVASGGSLVRVLSHPRT